MRAELLGKGSFYLDLPDHKGVLEYYLALKILKGVKLEIRYRKREAATLNTLGWPDSESKTEYTVSRELAAKTALCCFGLLPAEVYADALQEEVPEAEWAAELLREWARAERDNGT